MDGQTEGVIKGGIVNAGRLCLLRKALRNPKARVQPHTYQGVLLNVGSLSKEGILSQLGSILDPQTLQNRGPEAPKSSLELSKMQFFKDMFLRTLRGGYLTVGGSNLGQLGSKMGSQIH